ncbi:tetratricopeptide repeat protein [Marinomonas mediterranea]|uniref:tetratricopeptide repeat protein n=1 Tax=Marinomonas mediterranea TaxID=119864 RepID=UPI00234BD9F0|nr:hypothetical protein [Marinomonas mediterranea]WCN10365.1 hypothetical protein GV055_16305 [Marinomonas mediterranea]
MTLTLSIVCLLLTSVLTLVWFVSRTMAAERMDVPANQLSNELSGLSRSKRLMRMAVFGGSIIFIVLSSTVLYKKLGYQEDVSFVSALRSGLVDSNLSTEYLVYRSKRYDHYSDWYYLAEHYLANGQYRLANSAYKNALERMPNDSAMNDKTRILNGNAEALFMLSNNKVTPDLVSLVEQILVLDPENSSALGFAGVIAYNKGKFNRAFLNWGNAFRFSPSAQERWTLLQTMRRAQTMIETDPISVAQFQSNKSAGATLATISNVIYLTLAIPDDANIASGAEFLVYAKVDSVPYPISVQKVALPDALGTILLTNMDFMIEGKTLADFSKVDILVRMSTQGGQELANGRIVGELLGVPTNAQKIFEVNVVL